MPFESTSHPDQSLHSATRPAGVAGALFNGVLLPYWYTFIHRVLPVDTPRTIAVKSLGNCVAWGCAGNA